MLCIRGEGGGGQERRSANREGDQQQRGVCDRRARGGSGSGIKGRALHWRSRSGERVCGEGRADGGEVRAGRVQQGGRAEAVPDRGYWKVEERREYRVCGKGRSSGEGERIPDRVGRDRSGIDETRSGQRGG